MNVKKASAADLRRIEVVFILLLAVTSPEMRLKENEYQINHHGH
jgi:hypothetical protein